LVNSDLTACNKTLPEIRSDHLSVLLFCLGEIHTWDVPEQLTVCRSLIAGLERDPKQPTNRKLFVLKTVFDQILFHPFSWQRLSKDSLEVTLRGFVIERDLAISAKETDEDRLEAMRLIRRLSHEAAIAVIATVLADSDTSDNLRSELEELTLRFPRSATRPKKDDAAHWEGWVSEHADIVAPYMENDLTKLKESIAQARETGKAKNR